MSSSDADYVCTLDSAALKKASEELNEDPRERLSAVKTFREWILAQPHLNCPTDTLTLLAFLRARKFSQLESRQLLEDFIVVKTKNKQWFENIDTTDPAMQAVFKEGFVYFLPKRDTEGRLLVVVNFGKLQPWSGRYSKLDIFRALVALSLYTFFNDEATQVHGVAVVDDLTGLTVKHQTMFSIEEQKTFFGGWHKCIPARIKKIWLYNLGGFGDFIYMIMKLIMPEKILKRVQNVGSVAEDLYREIPMDLLPSEYLPDDYTGPNAGSIQHNIDRLVAALAEPRISQRIRELSDSKFKVDESKRPSDVTKESFRKLNVD